MKKKGFTLIELLAVIVILAIIALIAIPIIINLIGSAKKKSAIASTYGYIDAIEYSNNLSDFNDGYSKYPDQEYEDLSQFSDLKLKGERPDSGILKIKNSKVVEGVFCIRGYSVSYNGVEASIEGSCDGSIKKNGFIKLSSSNGKYNYPDIGKVIVVENKSGGNLSCNTSDSEIATCSINGDEVTIQTGKKEGIANITIISQETDTYYESEAVYAVITEKGTLNSYTAENVEKTYDGNSYGILVEATDALVMYSSDNDNYSSTRPLYRDAGEYTTYFKIIKDGYKDIIGSKTVIINKAPGELLLGDKDISVNYLDTKNVSVLKNISSGKMTVSSKNSNIIIAKIEDGNIILDAKGVGNTTVTIESEETKNYEKCVVTINVFVKKANNTLILSSTSGQYIYPTKGTFNITSNTSGGLLTCESSDIKIATCSISGTTVTVTPGTTEGIADILITSEATENYEKTSKVHAAIVLKGSLLSSISANNYSGIYDGKPHSITVSSSDSTITYSTSSDGTYSSTNPSYTDVGTYTVYYKVSKEGYSTVTGNKTVTITKAAGSIISPKANILTYTGNAQELVSGGKSTSYTTIEYKLEGGTYSTNIPKATDPGSYVVYYRGVGDKNHTNVSEGSIEVEIKKADITYSSAGYMGVYDSNSHHINVETNGTVKYGTSEGTYDLTENPTYSDVGIYPVYYQITKTGYNTVTGVETVNITKANNSLTLSSTSGQYTYPTTGTFDITSNISGGSLTCQSRNTNIATCSVSGTTVTVTPGTTEGTAELVVKAATTKNYEEVEKVYAAIVSKGNLLSSISANNYSGVYDGNSHSITVSSSDSTITYSTSSNGTYGGTNPSFTDVGIYTVYYKINKDGYNEVTGSKTVTITPAVPNVIYNSGSNTCSWKNNYNLTIVSGNGKGISTYEIDVNNDGNSDYTTGSNFVPSNGFSTCNARFRAVDVNGNRSGWTTEHHIHQDTGGPGAVTVTYNSGSNTCSWKNNYNISLSASDNVAVAHYEIDYHGDGSVDTTTGSNFIPWNGYSSCTTIFRAVDYAGNKGPWTSVNHIHMDTEAPSKTTVNLNGYSSGSWTNGNVTQTASASDNVGVSYYQYSHDGANVAGNFPNPWTINWDGQWNFYVRAVDHAGNAGAWSNVYTIRRDATAPSITSVRLSGRDGVNKNATLSYSVSDGSVTCYYGIGNYNSSVAASTTSCTLTGLAPGNVYNYNIVARDSLGNQSNVTGTFVSDGWYSPNSSVAIPTWYYYLNGTRYAGLLTNLYWKSGKLVSDYYFDSTGAMVRGWVAINGQWYYAINEKYTYFETSDSDNNNSRIPAGSLAKNRWLCIPDDNSYHSSSNNGHYYWYHFNANGVYDQKSSACWSGTACHNNSC